jgi:hypothetical protein
VLASAIDTVGTVVVVGAIGVTEVELDAREFPALLLADTLTT